MESKTDDALKARFLAVRKEIYNRYTAKQQNEQQAAIVTLKRSMTDREWESEVIEIDTDITSVGASKKTCVASFACQRRHERWNPCYPVRSVPGIGQAVQRAD